MKKIFLFVLLVGALLVTPSVVNATTEQPTCGDNQSYVGEYVEGTVTQGECISWSESTCLSYTSVCSPSWAWWNCHNVCNSWSTPTCTAYEEITTEGSWVGNCVDNEEEIIDEEDDEEIPAVEESNASHSVGGSWVTRLPKVVDTLYVYNGCVHFLTTHNSIGGILLGRVSSQFPLDTYRKPYQDPIGWPVCSTEMLGYDYRFEEVGMSVYHTICPTVKGTWFARPYMDNYYGDNGYGKLYGDEAQIDL
jgi:hypothetical protein